MMAVDLEKQQARWRRNKQAERARKAVRPHELPSDLIKQILAERDRRIAETEYAGMLIRSGYDYFASGSYEKAICFLANIWAADLLLKAQWGCLRPKPSLIAKQLDQWGVAHGYSDKSLPKMIYKARKRIAELEKPLPWHNGQPIWPPYTAFE